MMSIIRVAIKADVYDLLAIYIKSSGLSINYPINKHGIVILLISVSVWWCLRKKGAPEGYITIIQDMYNDCETLVSTRAGDTEYFKALHHLAPSYLTDLLQLYHPTRTLRSSSDSLLTARCARLRNYGDRAFCVAAPKLWNDLPLNIRECGSVHSFKRLLKTYFFKRAFNI